MKHLLFVSDSLRADHLSCFGHSRETSPHIDSLASDGVRFTRAYSQAFWTGASSGSLLTGRYPLAHPTGYNKAAEDPETTVTDEFRSLGHTTASISGSGLTVLKSAAHGFDEHHYLTDEHGPADPKIAVVTVDKAIDWIDDHSAPGDDWFLIVWNMGTHTPYTTPNSFEPVYSDNEGGDVTSLKMRSNEQAHETRDLYDDTIRHTDEEFGRLVSYLRSKGLYSEMQITMTADHGEVFDEHCRLEMASGLVQKPLGWFAPGDLQKKFSLGSKTAYVGHQNILPYEELLHVPLIMKFPENRWSGTTSDELVQLIDIPPTHIDIEREFGDSDPEPSQYFQGTSLLPTVRSGEKANDVVYSSTPVLYSVFTHHSVYDGEYKYIKSTADWERWDRVKIDPRGWFLSLLDVVSSPSEILFSTAEGESTNIIDEHHEKYRELKRKYQSWEREKSFSGNLDDVQREFDDQQLRDLGYME